MGCLKLERSEVLSYSVKEFVVSWSVRDVCVWDNRNEETSLDYMTV